MSRRDFFKVGRCGMLSLAGQCSCVMFCLLSSTIGAADDSWRVLDGEFHHLRNEGEREWTEFPETAEDSQLVIEFPAAVNDREATLRIRQQDVKQTWQVTLHDRSLGQLIVDENDMLIYFAVPPGTLKVNNVLRIAARGNSAPDDIRLGEVAISDLPRSEALREATVELEVLDADSERRLPCRITVTRHDGALQTTAASSNEHLAVRSGIIYSSDGLAKFGLPAGAYTIFAGRGFEYSLDRVDLKLAAGEIARRTMKIRREVPTDGYVACDTHVHTLTHSGHGDATVQERMITLAGEGIELPIATDHNVHVDQRPFAAEMNVAKQFTPVIGNEVTTRVGHFNIFPVEAGSRIPDFKLDDWGDILDDIYRTPGVKVAILNHARDLHGGTRPFGPALHNSVVGENVAGWPIRFNAMEVVNSGATQTDVLQLFRDWMALLNRGHRITPVGSSDSHDVARHFVGQGRTYIRCDDRDPGSIDVDQAVKSFVQGRVMVSYGLLAEMTVNGKYGSGELVRLPDDDPVTVSVRVLAPHWIEASEVLLFANGQLIRTEQIDRGALRDLPAGVKWRGQWQLDRPSHDVHLVAIAIGPGIDGSYWKTAKPYQPTSPDWTPHVIGCSGAIWLDADNDGRPTAAYDYATRLDAAANGDLARLIEYLQPYDTAIAIQAAHLYQSSSGRSLLDDEAQTILNAAAPHVRAGVQAYLDAWRETQQALGVSAK